VPPALVADVAADAPAAAAAAAACPVGTETRVEYFIIIKPSKHDIRWLRI